MPVQTTYSDYPASGYPGGVARPSEPHGMDSGTLYVTSGEAGNPKPGDAVHWNATQNRFQVPTTTAQARRAVGVLGYRVDTVANDANQVRFKDGDAVQVCVLGTVWCKVGEGVEYGDAVIFDTSDDDWVKFGGIPADAVEAEGTSQAQINTALASLKDQIVEGLRAVEFTVVSPEPVASGSVAQVRIGFGRIT